MCFLFQLVINVGTKIFCTFYPAGLLAVAFVAVVSSFTVNFYYSVDRLHVYTITKGDENNFLNVYVQR